MASPAWAAGPPASGPEAPPIGGKADRELKYDWVQVASGEWVKGSIDRMEDEDLYFDSDEFGDVKIGWGDVATLVSKGPLSLRMINEDTYTGRVELAGGVARVYTASGVEEIDPAQVMQIIAGTLTEKNYWSGGASVSVSARGGNTDQTDINIRANLIRRTVLTRWTTRYIGEISTVDSADTANSHRVPTAFDVFLTPKLFLTTPSFEYFTDEFQNINTRLTTGLGLGYEVYENPWLFFQLGTGAAHVWTKYESVVSGSDAANDAAVLFSTVLNFDLPRGIEWDNSYQVAVVVTDLDKTNQHAESILSFDIWGPLEAELAFIFDRVENPVREADGVRPKSNDYRLTAGIGVDF